MDWFLLLSSIVPMIIIGVPFVIIVGILWRIFKKLK